jgi:outer membrane protein TolC
LGAGNFFGFGSSVQLPLLTGSRIRSNIAVHEARIQQALRLYEQEVLAAFEETGERSCSVSPGTGSPPQPCLGRFGKPHCRRIGAELYLAGIGDFLSVLEAQRSQFAAEEEFPRSETALRTNLIALLKAPGGGLC